jgi:hypothetical protein
MHKDKLSNNQLIIIGLSYWLLAGYRGFKPKNKLILNSFFMIFFGFLL